MPLQVTRSEDLRQHLQQLGLQEGDNVVVHSRLLSFGLIEGEAATVLQALQQTIGPTGTLIVPTYTFASSAAPGTDMGPLSELVRQQPDAVRSRCPIHSHAAIGRLRDRLTEPDGSVSLGPGSDFDLMQRHDCKLLLLGCRFSQGATFLHHLEAVAHVPYRCWVDLPTEPIGCRYYSRRQEQPVRENFDAVIPWMMATGALQQADCPYGRSYCMRLRDLAACVLAQLDINPYALILAT
ncbi:MAG: AAC(3) family N-acetyltransferase [Magnetococcales bacterium]|nr:AAC(3) family N-acetyltransferase [Magnetococcales bacterium]